MKSINIIISDTFGIELTVFEFIFLSLIFLLLITIAIYLIILCFVPGKEVQIKVVKKWITKRESFNTNLAKMTASKNYLVKCLFLDSKKPDKIRTLNCESELIYRTLKTGKTYIVTIKLLHIFKVQMKNR